MIKSRFGAGFDPVIHRILPFLARLRTHPDTLTLIGVGLAAVTGVIFALGEPFAAVWALGFAGAFDMLDGVVARAQGSTSAAGAFLDSSMDRLSDLLIFGGIAYGFASGQDLAGLAVTLWALSGSVMTSYTRARAERHLARFEVGVMERGERFIVLILGALTGFLEVALWIIAIGATVTTLQRLVVARRLLGELERSGVDPTAAGEPDESSEAVRREA